MKNHVILCGLGRVGWRVLAYLQAAGAPVVVIDTRCAPGDPQLAGARLVPKMAINSPGATPAAKLAPFTIPPLLIAGVTAVIEKGTALDVPPSTTVMFAVPAAAIRSAVTAAVNCVALVKEVASAVEFHCTFELAVKPVPATVNGNAAPPTGAELGDRLPMAGPAGVEAFTVKV